MADPIKTDKVKVTTIKSTDPEILVTIDTMGANISSGDSLSVSLVIMGEDKVVIPSTKTTHLSSSSSSATNGGNFTPNNLHDFSIEIPSFINNNTVGELPGYLFVSLVDSDTNAGTVLVLKVYTIKITPVPEGSPIIVDGSFSELFTHDPATGTSTVQ